MFSMLVLNFDLIVKYGFKWFVCISFDFIVAVEKMERAPAGSTLDSCQDNYKHAACLNVQRIVL